tara:strand:+ start:15633 stop:15776 length:144 start_codon:yes stop_codon:yes gene_type:complete
MRTHAGASNDLAIHTCDKNWNLNAVYGITLKFPLNNICLVTYSNSKH